jgi:hypothetical protein
MNGALRTQENSDLTSVTILDIDSGATSRIEPAGHCKPWASDAALGGPVSPQCHEFPILLHMVVHAASPHQLRDIVFRHGFETGLSQSIVNNHQMSRKAFDQTFSGAWQPSASTAVGTDRRAAHSG